MSRPGVIKALPAPIIFIVVMAVFSLGLLLPGIAHAQEPANTLEVFGVATAADDAFDYDQEATEGDTADSDAQGDASEELGESSAADATAGEVPEQDAPKGATPLIADTTWQNDYRYTLDEENKIITVTRYLGGQKNVTLPGTAVINGVTYRTALAAGWKKEGSEVSVYARSGAETLVLGEGVILPEDCSYLFILSTFSSIDLGRADASGVKNVANMIPTDSYGLRYLDVSCIDCSSVEGASDMFMNNSMGSTSLKEIVVNDTIYLPDAFNTGGTVFSGWNTAEDGSGTTYYGSATAPVAKGTHLYALEYWQEKGSNGEWEYVLPSEHYVDDDTGYKVRAPRAEGVRVLLTRYIGSSTNVVVPATITIDGRTYPTMLISNQSGDYARPFQGTNVQAISFEDGVSLGMSTSQLFAGATKLRSVDLSNVDTSSIRDMVSMFDGCTSLEEVNLAGLDTSHVSQFFGMFRNCEKLQHLDLTSFTFESAPINGPGQMFTGCKNLSEVVLGPGFVFNTGGVIMPYWDTRALLPDPPTSDGYNGLWQRVGTNAGYTAEELANTYDSSMAGTWVWSRGMVIGFDANGGSGFMPRLVVELADDGSVPSSATLPGNEFLWDGRSFLGWSLEPGKQDVAYADGAAIVPVDGLMLYAQWGDSSSDTYTITIHVDTVDIHGQYTPSYTWSQTIKLFDGNGKPSGGTFHYAVYRKGEFLFEDDFTLDADGMFRFWSYTAPAGFSYPYFGDTIVISGIPNAARYELVNEGSGNTFYYEPVPVKATGIVDSRDLEFEFLWRLKRMDLTLHKVIWDKPEGFVESGTFLIELELTQYDKGSLDDVVCEGDLTGSLWGYYDKEATESLSYYRDEDENGENWSRVSVFYFRLRDGEWVTLRGLPINSFHYLTERGVTSRYYSSLKEVGSGQLYYADAERVCTYVNQWSNSSYLVVEKHVQGEIADPDEEFEFVGTFTEPDGTPILGTYHYVRYTNDGSMRGYDGSWNPVEDGAEVVSFTLDANGQMHLKLKAGEAARFYNMPFGCIFSFSEVEDGLYEVVAYNATNEYKMLDPLLADYDYSQQFGSELPPVIFVNVRKPGGVEVGKTVEGAPGDKDRQYEFEIVFSDPVSGEAPRVIYVSYPSKDLFPSGTVFPEGTVFTDDGKVLLPYDKLLPAGVTVSPDGTVTLPDGTTVSPDGTVTLPDGTTVKTSTTGSPRQLPDGTMLLVGATTTLPDGTVVESGGDVTLPDGTVVGSSGKVHFANGAVLDASGNLTLPNGYTIRADGRITDARGWYIYYDSEGWSDDQVHALDDGSLEFSDGTIFRMDGTITLPDGTIIRQNSVQLASGERIASDRGITSYANGVSILPYRGTPGVSPVGYTTERTGWFIYGRGWAEMPDGSVYFIDPTTGYYNTMALPGGIVRIAGDPSKPATMIYAGTILLETDMDDAYDQGMLPSLERGDGSYCIPAIVYPNGKVLFPIELGEDGTLRFVLKDGQVISFEFVPAGTGYKVSEKDYSNEGITTETTKATGEASGLIFADGNHYASTEVPDSSKAHFVNARYTSVDVHKVWNDADNSDGTRPGSVTVWLVVDGVRSDRSLVLSTANGWSGAFDGLLVYIDGRLAVYSIEEDAVVGYVAVISGTPEDGFIVTNTHEPTVPGDDVEKPDTPQKVVFKSGSALPKTADALPPLGVSAIALLALLALALFLLCWRRGVSEELPR